MTELAIEIAGVAIDLRGAGGPPALAARYGPFARRAGEAALRVELVPGPAAPPEEPRVVADGVRWTIAGAPALGHLDPEAGEGIVALDPFANALDTLLRAAVARAVLARGGALVHAAALRVEGEAHLCPGRSGAGKSTLASLSRARIADEIAALLPAPDGGFLVHGTPWWRGSPEPAPLAAVYELAWGGEGVACLPRGGVLRHLATNLVLPIDGPGERRAALAAVARVAASTRFRRLVFRPDSDVDGLLRAAEGVAA